MACSSTVALSSLTCDPGPTRPLSGPGFPMCTWMLRFDALFFLQREVKLKRGSDMPKVTQQSRGPGLLSSLRESRATPTHPASPAALGAQKGPFSSGSRAGPPGETKTHCALLNPGLQPRTHYLSLGDSRIWIPNGTPVRAEGPCGQLDLSRAWSSDAWS